MGMTRGTGRAHIVRAALEAIALQCADIVDLFRSETGLPLDTLRVDGGAARNDLLMQLQSDLAGSKVSRAVDIESTARGAAALAGLGAGLWTCIQDVPVFEEQGASFAPGMDRDQVQALRRQWVDALGRTKTR